MILGAAHKIRKMYGKADENKKVCMFMKFLKSYLILKIMPDSHFSSQAQQVVPPQSECGCVY